ncbi:MAG: C25 family cysteine peptidase, partial [Candidatus Hermodarchaeota archaeon]
QFDQDWNNDSIVDYGECDGNRVNNYFKNLLPDNWTSIFLAQTEGIKGTDNYSDVQLNYNNLRYAIDDGCSIGIINAHGAPQSMGIDEWIIDYDGDMLFDYTADPYLEGGTPIDVSIRTSLIDTSYASLKPEDDKLGLFYLASCSTGTFDDPDDCLSEYFLKNAAIGCVAASYVAWGEDQWYEREHGGWFTEGLGFRFWEQLFQYNQPGKALALAKADYVADRINSSEPNDYPEWEDKTLKQYNLLGDPEVPIWLSIPKQLNISDITAQNSSSTSLNLQITADNDPIQGVTLTYTKDQIIIWKGQTNENGTIEIPISQIDIDGNILTASKIGFLPYQENIPQDQDMSSIAGYDSFGISFIILSFICISSVYFRFILSKRKTS